jgi:hypothetical protein
MTRRPSPRDDDDPIHAIPQEDLINRWRHTADPAVWVREKLNWESRIGPIDPWQTEALNTSQDSLWNCTRQAGKSTTAAAKALHKATFFPRSLTLVVSPSLRQSIELFKKVSEHYDALMGDKMALDEDNKTSCEFTNGSRIVSLPGEEKTIRGFSKPDLIIEDEASRVDDALYAAIRPMLAVSHGQLVLMSTPFGKRGHFFQAWEKGGSKWARTKIPWWECPRITPEFILSERETLGDWWVAQEYECEFVQTVDQVFNYDLIMEAIDNSIPPLFVNGKPIENRVPRDEGEGEELAMMIKKIQDGKAREAS